MKRCLLINPSYKAAYGSAKASLIDPIFPTVGLLTLAAMLEKHGHEVQILDMSYQQYDYRTVEKKIQEFQPDVIGVTVTTPLMNQIRDISTFVKTQYPHIMMVAGGPHVSALPIESLEESMLDVVVVGEGDLTLPDILNGTEFTDVLGIFYRDEDGRIHGNPARPYIENLDDLPMPAWHLFNSVDYRDRMSRLLVKKTPCGWIEFSRGCIYKCDFCASKNTMAYGYRKKSPKRCAEEVKLLYEYGWREFALADDIFTSDRAWAKEVCKEIIKTGLGVPWSCMDGIRVESAEEELFQLMRQAGCYRVSFGIETGNADVLKGFGKGGKASLKEGINAVKLAHKANIDVNAYFMLGLSPDTEESMQDTIDYAKSVPLDMLKFGIAIAFPGTKMFHDYRERYRINSYNWDDYIVYTSKPLFSHPNLKFETVQKYMKKAYRDAIYLNPGFILHRFLRGLRTMDIFWDMYYFIKFITAPTTSDKEVEAKYFNKDMWPKYNFRTNKINFIPVRSAQNKEVGIM